MTHSTKRSLALAGIAAIGLASAAEAQSLMLNTNVPPSHWVSTEGLVPFMDCVKTASKGAVSFNYFPSGQIATHAESLNAVNNGITQVSYLVISALTEKMPINGISMLPNMGDTVVEMTKASRKVIEADGPYAKEFSDNRVVPILINMFPAYQIMSRTGKISTLEDFKGKKISVVGGAQTFTVQSLGATPIELSPGDIYMALQQSTVDGNIYALPSVISWKLDEVTQSISTNGTFGSASGILAVDTGVWQEFTPEAREAMSSCGLKMEIVMAEYADRLSKQIEGDLAKKGIDVYAFSEEEKARIGVELKKASEEYIRRLDARGLPGQAAYNLYIKALGKE